MLLLKLLPLSIILVAFSYIQVKVSSETYDENIAKQLFDFSLTTYCLKKQIANWNCGIPCSRHPGVNEIEIFANSKEHQGLIVYDKDQDSIILAFRGTNFSETLNIQTNLDIRWNAYPYCENCKVHNGFREAQEELHNPILPLMRKQRQNHPYSKFQITGHSLGGAFAVLSQIELVLTEEKQFDITGVYTFGGPRIGNAEFAKWVAEKLPHKIWRVVNGNDLVPQLPFIFFGQKHFPYEVYQEKTLPQRICNESGEDMECTNKNFIPNTEDHFFQLGVDIKKEREACRVVGFLELE